VGEEGHLPGRVRGGGGRLAPREPNTEVQGQYGGGTATELFTIGDVDRLWAMADVYELDVARVHAGAHVEVTVPAYPGPFEGTVDLVAPMLDPATRTTKVRCVLDNPEARLKPEMYATIRVAVDPHRALTIPKSAILRLGDQTVVFVQKAPTVDGRIRFERKPVLVDEAPEGVAVVQHGLDAGELVVTRGAALLVGMI
jgi:RND family efflux transporter MFP subunit